MKKLKKLIIGLLALIGLTSTQTAQAQDERGNIRQWDAYWITVPEMSLTDYAVCYFRKAFDLKEQPKEFLVNVTGDTRYKFYVNGEMVAEGPARSDLMHWNFDTIDLSPWLHAGQNVVAAKVINEGKERSEGNFTYATGFLLQGLSNATKVVNTDSTWLCMKDEGFRALSQQKLLKVTYYVGGPGEDVDMRLTVGDWYAGGIPTNAPTRSLSPASTGRWQKARQDAVPPMAMYNAVGFPDGRLLQPSPLPQREHFVERLQAVRQAEGIKADARLLQGQKPLTIPANTKVRLLLDNQHLTNGFFTLLLSGGKDAQVEIEYQETLFEDYPRKGNRNDVEGKQMIGRQDRLVMNGRDKQTFSTMTWRTYRYVELKVQTADQPLTIDDVYGIFTGYPFELKARLDTDNQEVQQIFETGWRTARLCAVETYMDCPYYEQLQYMGDSRIQELITLYNSGDERFVKNYLTQASLSALPEGVLQSRYPSVSPQVITPFCLWYIGSLHDYMMMGSDQQFVADKLGTMRNILNYFAHYQQADGSICELPWWNFTDWVETDGWKGGVFVGDGHLKNSALIDLQLLQALIYAADLERTVGIACMADIWQQRADQLKQTITRKYYDAARDLFADDPQHEFYSQHTNALGIMTGLVSPDNLQSLAQKIIDDKSLAQGTLYFRYYVNRSLVMAGLGDHYLDWLDPWRENLQMGLTTWAETSDVQTARSDCHAWGASPNIEFFRTVLGIQSAAPAFQQVLIEPHLGTLRKIGGTMPHPAGKISVSYEVKGSRLTATIDLPAGISGTFVWKGQQHALHGGSNKLTLSAN